MLVGAIAEMLTIGAALPFLALIAAPEQVTRWPAISRQVAAIGGDPVLAAALFLAAAAVAAAMVRVLLVWAIHRFATAVGHDLAARIFGRMLRQPYAAYVRRSSSEILSGVERIQQVITDILLPGMQGVTSGFIALAIMTLLFLIDAFAAVTGALVVTAVYAAISLAMRGRLLRNSAVLSEASAARLKIVQEGLGGIRDVILDRSQPLFEEKFRRVDTRYRRAQSVTAFIATAPRFVIEAAGIVAIALIAWAMSREPGGIIAAIPVLGALALGAQRLLPLLHRSYSGLSLSAGAFGLLGDVIALVEAPVIGDDPPGAGAELAFNEAIVFDSVCYRHEDGGFALRNIDLEIPRGARIGVTGPTGSGKSTLLDLLMGLLAPDSGAVRIDGLPLAAATRALWQAKIAHVPQGVYLADDSIAANIAFGVEPAAVDRARLGVIVAAAQLDAFVLTLPEGLETRVGERGIRLSGGQRQRIGLARALYKQASVLILDEATSVLDDATEAAVMRAIMALGKDITIVMIAHRQSTLGGCDRLIRLEEGQVVKS
ncbi:MAG TPA: ABC transporter ATP-binding protein [Allosphingosinicella sp.]|nr:ABC transporter ATP-binding protein [Allosphingosinicella sp.]